MQKIKNYLSLEGWKADLEQTLTDLKDIKILTKRTLGFSHYGFKNGAEMTSREVEDFCWKQNALWFDNEEEFQIHAMTNLLPLGRCLIGHGKNARRYDDTLFPEKFQYTNSSDYFTSQENYEKYCDFIK